MNESPENLRPGPAERLARLSPEKRTLLQRKLETQQVSGIDLVAQSLSDCGITHIYGVAGSPTQPVLAACNRRQIRAIGPYHQTSAVLMALAHNYQAGQLVAATLVSTGPATTNAITGLLVAQENGWPVIVMGGQRSSFQTFDAIPSVKQVTKYCVEVPSADAIGNCIHEAYQIAISGRPGPVYVQLHEDILMGNADASSLPAISPIRTVPGLKDVEIESIVHAAISASRPSILLGEGIRWSVVPEQLKELIEVLDIPIITSPMGRGFLPDDHPLCLNQARTALQAETDFALVLGARLNWVFRHGSELSPKASVIRCDLELDVEDKAVVEHQFIQCDPGEMITHLLDAVKARCGDFSDPGRKKRMGAWHKHLRSNADETRRLLNEKFESSKKQPMSPYRMMKEIRDALPRDAICISEGYVSMVVAQQVIPAYRPTGRMDAGMSACMGVGIPFGIGAGVAKPDRPVVVITGDYGFSLTAMEMEVCVRQEIPILVIVANNQGNIGAMRQKTLFPQEGAELVTMYSPGLEYNRIMEVFGGLGTTVTEPDQLKSAIEEALAGGLPTCINVVIDPHEPIPNAWGEQAPNLASYE